MKKSILIVLVLLFLLLLTACQSVPATQTDPAGSTPPPSSITPPSSSVVPSTSSVPATSAPVTTPNSSTGYPRIHKEYISPTWDAYDLSDCIVGYLYWLDKETHKVTLLLAEQISCEVAEGPYIYYVKEAEPTKIYRILIGDPAQQVLVHETTHGKVGDMTIYPGIENYLQFVTDNKKFVVFEFDTGVETVLMEQHEIEIAHMGSEDDGTLGNWIWFRGKPTGEEPYSRDYFYYRDTGEIELDPYL